MESPTLNALDPWPQAVTWHRVSGRLITVELIAEALRTLILVAIAGGVWLFTESVWALVAGAAVLVWALIRSYVIVRAVRSYGYAERERDLLVRHGRLIRRLSIVPYARMQFVDVTAGPFERAFKLATLRLHTAAAASDAVIPGLAPQEATRLRDRLASLGEDQGEGLWSSPVEQNGRDAVIPMRRLHPLSPVLRGLRLFALAVAALSWRTLQDLHFLRWLLVVGLLFVAVLAYSAVSWRFTGFEVIGRELRMHEGLVSRRVRTVPLERLQAIEVVQPALARLFGLAELKLDVAGAQKSEAPLSFLPMSEATALRERLLGLAGGAAATPSESDDHETAMHRVKNADVVFSQLLTPPVMLTPLAVLYVVGQVVFNEDFGFFAIASMITAVIATIGRPVSHVLNYWHFRLARREDGWLRIRSGLFATRSQVIPPHRIQSLTITWPLLWRPKGWLRVTLAVAGQSSSAEDRRRTETDRLLPVADIATARALLPFVVPGVDPAAMPLTRVPGKAAWLAPLRARILAAGLGDTVFAAVDGLLTRTLTVVPYGRIQSVRITQGPVQRALGLASVHADVANSSPVTAWYRPLAEAYAWVDELARRALAARQAQSPEKQGGPGSTRQE